MEVEKHRIEDGVAILKAARVEVASFIPCGTNRDILTVNDLRLEFQWRLRKEMDEDR